MSKQKKFKLLRRLKNRMHPSPEKHSGQISPLVHIVFVVMILAGGVFYLVEVNETSTQGFKIRSLERKVDQLEDISKELEFRQAEVSSLHSLTERADDLQLVSVDRLETLDEEGELALSR